MTLPTFTVEADLDGDGTWETDLSAAVNTRAGGFKLSRGMNADGIYQVSRFNVGLDNDDGAFTPDYPSGTYYGQLGPGIPIRVVGHHNSIDYTLWTGYAESWKVRAGKVRVCDVGGVDLAKFLAESEPVNVAVSTSRDTDGAIQAVLEAIGLDSGDWSLDDGLQDLPYSYAIQQTAMEAIMAFVRSEMGGRAYILADGRFKFESRAARLGTTADYTWGDGSSVEPEQVDVEHEDSELVSSVTVRGTRYLTGQDGEEVFRFSLGRDSPADESLQIAAGAVYERTFALLSPVLSIYTATATTDYAANDNADGSGTDRTGSLTVTYTLTGGGQVRVSITNGHSGAVYVTLLRVRGQAVAFYADRPQYSAAISIPGQKAGHGVNLDVPFADADSTKLRDFAFATLHTYRYAYPRLTLSFAWDTDAITVDMLSAELGELVQFADEGGVGVAAWATHVNDLWYIERIEHAHVPPLVPRSKITLVPAYLYTNLDAVAYDEFDRANASGDLGTSTSGHTWANDSGFDIASNKARPNGTGLQIPTVDIGKADFAAFVSLSNLSSDTDEGAGFVFRYVDGSNYWLAFVYDVFDQIWLQKIVAGVVTNVAAVAWTPADTAELRLIVQGNRIRLWVDRVLVIDEEDSDLNTATKHGLTAQGTTTVDFTHFAVLGLS